MKINSSAIFSTIRNITTQFKNQPINTCAVLMNLNDIKNTAATFHKTQDSSATQAATPQVRSRQYLPNVKRKAPQPTAEMKAAVALKKALQHHSEDVLSHKLRVALEQRDPTKKNPLSEKDEQRFRAEIMVALKMFNIHAKQREEMALDAMAKKNGVALNLKASRPAKNIQRVPLEIRREETLSALANNRENVQQVRENLGFSPLTDNQLNAFKTEQVKQVLGNRVFKKIS